MGLSSQIERAVIVGAGLAGLTVAYHLRRKGLDPLLLDSGDAIGSSWRSRHPQLTLNTHRTVSHLPGLKYPAKTPAFPRRDDVVRHLDAFSQLHAFRMVHGSDVTSIRHLGGTFEVEVGEDTIKATNVIIATGRDRDPVEPSIAGGETYTGTRLHAAHFGDARQYRGMRVLVIGGGNSGFDVVNNLSRTQTAHIWLSVHTGSAILPQAPQGPRRSPVLAPDEPVAVIRFEPGDKDDPAACIRGCSEIWPAGAFDWSRNEVSSRAECNTGRRRRDKVNSGWSNRGCWSGGAHRRSKGPLLRRPED